MKQNKRKLFWDAVYIGERRDANHNILLYQRDNFYIEVFHHMEYNVIRRIRSFSNTDQLQPYIGQIDVVNLINGSDK